MMNKEYDLFLPWQKLSPGNLFPKFSDEYFFRLNPHWIITSFTLEDSSYTAKINDHETEEEFIIKGNITKDPAGFLTLTGDASIWRQITFFDKDGSLHAAVIYNDQPTEEEEKRIVLWLRSIKEYLRLYLKNSINSRFFRLLMHRVILQMTPSQRKISLMLIRITALELIAIIAILVGWFFIFR